MSECPCRLHDCRDDCGCGCGEQESVQPRTFVIDARECPAVRENDATQCICGMCYTTTLAEIQARNIEAIKREMETPIPWLPKDAK